jgi:signal transduction histidine kinase
LSLDEVLTPNSYAIAIETANTIKSNYASCTLVMHPFLLELEMYKKDGTTVWTELKISPITDKESKHIGILGVSRNISIRKKALNELVIAKEKAEESNRLKSAFLTNISHEIRTPLNGIMGFSDLLQKPSLSEEKQKFYLSLLKKSGGRMLNTIEEIVKISQIEAGHIGLQITSVDLSELISYYHNFFLPEATEKGINYILSSDIIDQALLIKTDKTKLESIFSNLLNNAIKFTSEGFVELSCKIET